MENSSSNKNYILADQIRSAEICSQLRTVEATFSALVTIQEVTYSFSHSPPDTLIIDNLFLEKNSGGIENLGRTSPALKFVPVVYLGSPDDAGFSAFRYFGDVYCCDSEGQTGLAEMLIKLIQPSVGIKFWGVRGSTPCANLEKIRVGGNTSCVQIEKKGMNSILILDSGTGIRNLGNMLYRDHSGISGHIFITHPHWDHIQGFPFFKPFYSGKNTFNIHMPEQYRGGAQDILSGHLTKTFFPVTLNMLDAELIYHTQMEPAENFGDYSVEYMVANHPTKTAIYKIKIGGYSIIYSPDNEIPLKTSPLRFLEKFEEFIHGCDVLIHDAQFNLDQYETRKGWGHSAWERVLEISRKNKVKRLYLTHHDPDSNDNELAKIEELLSRYRRDSFTEVGLAKEGDNIRLPLLQ